MHRGRRRLSWRHSYEGLRPDDVQPHNCLRPDRRSRGRTWPVAAQAWFARDALSDAAGAEGRAPVRPTARAAAPFRCVSPTARPWYPANSRATGRWCSSASRIARTSARPRWRNWRVRRSNGPRCPKRARPRVLFVSVDPERDTPDAIGEYAHAFHRDTLAATADVPALETLREVAEHGLRQGAGRRWCSGRPVLDGPQRFPGGARSAGATDRIHPAAVRAEASPTAHRRRHDRRSTRGPRSEPDHRPHLRPPASPAVVAGPQAGLLRNRAVKQWLIDTVTRKFGVNLAEAADPDPTSYPTFNAFFTRALKPGARVAEADPRVLLMPADGKISECGHIGRADEGVLHEDPAISSRPRATASPQRSCSADEEAASAFDGGVYATVYLSPKDYHRVHMPWTGTLRETVHVRAGFSASARMRWVRCRGCSHATSALVCHFDCDFGPMAVIMVGALLVSGVETRVGRRRDPAYGGPVTVKDYRGQDIMLERFAEMARFNYGSTVIVLLPKGVAELAPQLAAQLPVRLGERLATLIVAPLQLLRRSRTARGQPDQQLGDPVGRQHDRPSPSATARQSDRQRQRRIGGHEECTAQRRRGGADHATAATSPRAWAAIAASTTT